MMRDCQIYSHKVTLSKTVINYSNHGFMLKTYRTDTFSSWKYTISNYYCKFRCSIGSKYITSPCYISKLALSPHKFTHPPPCRKWIRTFRKYDVMLPFSGITLQQNILKISKLLPDLWWMDKRQYSAPCLKKFPFLRRNRVHILKEIKVQEGENLPCDSRSARRIFKFQSCYGVGCPGTNIQCLTTSLRKERYVIYLSWKEEVYKKTVICIYIYTFWSMLCFKVYLKCVCVGNTKWYDLICVSDWVQYRWVRMLLETCNSFPKRNLVSSI
jgi:hypothetical protein